jgi:glycosyltransferase involved in cell wall biosynthesis
VILKKILYFSSSYKIGLTALLAEMACTLSSTGDSQFLFISGENEQMDGLFAKLAKHNIDFVKLNGLDDHSDFGRLVKNFSSLVKEFSPDIVHVQTNWQLAIAAVARLFSKEKYRIYYTVHGYRNNHKFKSIIARWLIGLVLLGVADKVIVSSSFLHKKFRFLGKKLERLFLGVDDSFFEGASPVKITAPKRIIFPGEFREGKNQDLIIRAVRKYVDLTGDQKIEIYFPGRGPKLEEYKALSAKLCLADKCFFPGFVDRVDMRRYYDMCQFAVIPTNSETFGLCIIEPYVLGRVVLSRPVGVATDIITHGQTGFLFENERELLELFCQVFVAPSLAEAVAVRAFANRDLFKWESICQRYLEIAHHVDAG